MSNLGIGVMIGMLGGNEETVKAITASIGQRIVDAVLHEDVISIELEDKTTLKLRDDGQSCCEHRYLHTDDNLSDLNGGVLVDITLEEAPSLDNDGDSHDVQFLRIKSDKTTVTVETHNVHNGYYGGFWVVATKE